MNSTNGRNGINEDKSNYLAVFKRIAAGVVISTLIASGLFLFNFNISGNEFMLYETLPYYIPSGDIARMFKILPDTEVIAGLTPTQNPLESGEYTVYTDGIEIDNKSSETSDYKIEDSESVYSSVDVIGTGSIIYQEDPTTSGIYDNFHLPTKNITIDNLDELRSLENLQKQFYVIARKDTGAKETDITPEIFDVDKFMSETLKLKESTDGPQVLVFHTHAREMYADSDTGNPYEGVIGIGDRLAYILENKYGIKTMHVTQSFDTVNGKSKVLGAYERMEPVINKVLEDNPSIEFVIDIHRDAIDNPDIQLTTQINGKSAAKIMFVNGLTKIYDQDGVLTDLEDLPNPYLGSNLALSFNLQLAANKLYPEFARKIYLKGYRYSLNMCPKSVLVEVGAATNTKEQALNATEPLADIIASVIN